MQPLTTFAALHGHYLDTPTMGVPPSAATDRMHAAIEEWARGSAAHEVWEQDLPRCRDAFAQLAHVPADAVALIPSIVPAAAAVGAVLAAGPGTVVAHRAEFRSLLLPVLHAVGAERIRWVDGPYTAQTFLAAIGPDVAAVLVSSVSSADGARPALRPVVESCHGAHAAVVVDATQSLGITALDVPLGALDAVLCSGYKGLLGPRGAAYAYLSGPFGDLPPLLPSPYGMADTPHVGAYGPPLRPRPGAPGLDQSPAWLSWIGALPALDLLAETPEPVREKHTIALAQRLCDGLVELGHAPQISDLPGPVVSVAADEPDGVVRALARANVRAAARRGRVRFGCHIYTTQDDIDAALSVLAILDQRGG